MISSTTADSCETSKTCRLSSDFTTLRQSALFAGIKLEVVKLFAYLSIRRSFQPQTYLVKQGEKALQSFLITKGRVDITLYHREHEFLLQQLKTGAVLGELALLAQFDWFFNARAIDTVEVVVIDKTVFQKVIEQYPAQKDKLTERVIQLRMKRLEDQTTLLLDRVLSDGWQPKGGKV